MRWSDLQVDSVRLCLRPRKNPWSNMLMVSINLKGIVLILWSMLCLLCHVFWGHGLTIRLLYISPFLLKPIQMNLSVSSIELRIILQYYVIYIISQIIYIYILIATTYQILSFHCLLLFDIFAIQIALMLTKVLHTSISQGRGLYSLNWKNSQQTSDNFVSTQYTKRHYDRKRVQWFIWS